MWSFDEEFDFTGSKGIETSKAVDSVVEAMLYSDISALSEDERNEFLNSTGCEILQEKNALSRKTMVRLTKQDDFNRRIKIAAYQIAKDKKDPLWTKLVKNRIIERALIAKIVQKYRNQAMRVAKAAQNNYIKMSNAASLPAKQAKKKK